MPIDMMTALSFSVSSVGRFTAARATAALMLIVAAIVASEKSSAAPVICVGEVCGDMRPVLNSPFQTSPNGMFYPEQQLQEALKNFVQLVRAGPPMVGRVPNMRYGFIQVQQRAPGQAQAPVKPPPSAAADPKVAVPQEDQRGVDAWFAECPQGQATGCQILRRIPGTNGAAGVTIIVGPDQRMPGRNQMTVVLPLGIAVRESVPMLIDEPFIALVPIETCLPAGCVLTVTLSPPMVAVLRGATALKFLALAPNGQTLPYAVPIGGFGEAYQKVAG